jgi:hypothetical protein
MHSSLIPLNAVVTSPTTSPPTTQNTSIILAPHDTPSRSSPGDNGPTVGPEDDSELAAIQAHATYDERLSARISDLRNFINVLEYQQQFADPRFLDVVDREGAAFFRLLEQCQRRENAENSTRTAAPTTWGASNINTMFLRTRPSLADHDT